MSFLPKLVGDDVRSLIISAFHLETPYVVSYDSYETN